MKSEFKYQTVLSVNAFEIENISCKLSAIMFRVQSGMPIGKISTPVSVSYWALNHMLYHIMIKQCQS